jgi:hypothetical protein
MNTAKLVKLAPTLILIAFLGYASYSLHESLPSRASGRSDVAKGLDMVEDMLASGTVAAARLIGEFRDPFQVSHMPSPQVDASQSQPGHPAEAPSDPLADLVRGMTLDATFFQGRDQIAIIDGRIYSRGQPLRFRNDSGEPSSQLVVTIVLPSKVILRGNNRNYVLSYPDQLGKRPAAPSPGLAGSSEATMLDPAGQLAMFQKLLNSPLGALGKGLIGKSALTDSLSGNTPTSRRRRSPTSPAGSATTRSGNP